MAVSELVLQNDLHDLFCGYGSYFVDEWSVFYLLTVIGMLETRIHAKCRTGHSGAVLQRQYKSEAQLFNESIAFL